MPVSETRGTYRVWTVINRLHELYVNNNDNIKKTPFQLTALFLRSRHTDCIIFKTSCHHRCVFRVKTKYKKFIRSLGTCTLFSSYDRDDGYNNEIQCVDNVLNLFLIIFVERAQSQGENLTYMKYKKNGGDLHNCTLIIWLLGVYCYYFFHKETVSFSFVKQFFFNSKISIVKVCQRR